MTQGLNLLALRAANMARLPQFKNAKGRTAHRYPDGSDWTPGQWLQALVGELGEFASVRLAYEEGRLTFEEYEAKAGRELADVQTYLDILAQRCLDNVGRNEQSPPSVSTDLMRVVAHLGEYANARKKFDRGDFGHNAFRDAIWPHINGTVSAMSTLCAHCLTPTAETAYVSGVHTTGVDLSRATIDKFNEVSERVGSTVRLHSNPKE